ELALVLRGRFEVITFDETGRVSARYAVGDETSAIGYETPRTTWHTLIACTDGATFLEVKEGPYDPATAAEFASSAPPEGDARVPRYLDWLRAAKVGDQSG